MIGFKLLHSPRGLATPLLVVQTQANAGRAGGSHSGSADLDAVEGSRRVAGITAEYSKARSERAAGRCSACTDN